MSRRWRTIGSTVTDERQLSDRLALRPKEAADALGVSERTLRALLPEIPHLRFGTSVLIPVEPLREWLRERAETERRHADAVVDDVMQAIADDS